METGSRNPFKPGFNRPPVVLVGRDSVLRSADALIDSVAEGDTGRVVVIVAPRGMGKTTVLSEIAAAAANERGWPSIRVEAKPGDGFVAEMTARLHEVSVLLTQSTPKERPRFQAVQASLNVLGVGGGVGFTRAQSSAEASPVDLEKAFAAAAERAVAVGSGFVVLVDELQSADRTQLAEFMAVVQAHVPNAWPVALFMAGLPEVQDKEKGVSYLERAEWHTLAMLTEAETVLALTGSSRAGGREMDPPAALALAKASGGYPFAVQVFGYHAWRASLSHERITLDHALEAIPSAQADLAAGLFVGRWNDASPREQEYLISLAELRLSAPEARIDGGSVSRRMGTTSAKTTYLRDRLLKKGTLYSLRGDLQFVVPGFAEWIKENHSS